MVAIESAPVGEKRPVEWFAERYGVSRATIWRWIDAYKLTRYRVVGEGKRTFLDEAEAERKLRAGRRVD